MFLFSAGIKETSPSSDFCFMFFVGRYELGTLLKHSSALSKSLSFVQAWPRLANPKISAPFYLSIFF